MFKDMRLPFVPLLVLVLAGGTCTFAQTASSTDTTPWLMQEVVFARFNCNPDDVVEMTFEGTSGIASNRITIQRWDLPTSLCPDLANALVQMAPALDCVASPVRASSWSTTAHLMCRGDRGAVISAIADLSGEILSFPITSGASASRGILDK